MALVTVPAMSAADGPASEILTLTLTVGECRPVPAAAMPATATGQTWRYESGNAGFFTVDAQGVVTGVHEGVSMLSIIGANGRSKDIRVEVTATATDRTPSATAARATDAAAYRGVPDVGIVIGNEGGQIAVGTHERIVAHVLPYQLIGPNPFDVESSDPSVVAVNNDAKTIAAIKEGTATITAQTRDGRHKAFVKYTVVPQATQFHPDAKTCNLVPARFGIRYDDASEEAAKANSAGLYNALRHTAESGFTRLLLEPGKVLYIEPKDTIHMVSNVQLDLNGSEIRLRPNDYPRYVAFLFAEKDADQVLHNASIVNGTLTGERDDKEAHLPNWSSMPATEGGCTIVFEEGDNNGIRNLTVRKSIGFNISSGLGSKAYGVRPFSQSPVSAANMEHGCFDDQGRPIDAQGMIRTKQPLDVSAFTTPYYTLGYPLGYMGYPYMNSRIYDAYFYDQDMKLLSSARGRIRYRQYALPQGAAFLHLAFFHDDVPPAGNSDFGGAFAFVENRAMPTRNFMIDCVIEDNFSCGFAACGGQSWLIKNNVFRRNGGRMPGCDIDWEDGWEYMQSDVIEGNRFESRINVITCAGIGLIFQDNTFRGESTFYGRSQHFSLLNNVFEKGETQDAHAVKLVLSSQTDIYACGNRYTHATMGYTRQHTNPPYVGTYEATFADETFDSTQILSGHITRLVGCTIRHGANHCLISAEHMDDCTIEKGSYTVGGTIRRATITDASFRVAPDKLLQIHDSTLTNPSFSASVESQGLLIDNCSVTVNDSKDKVLVSPHHLSTVTIRNSRITIDDTAAGYTVVGGWNATGAHSTITLDRVRFVLPSTFEGHLHKFVWYPKSAEEGKVTYNILNTDISGFHRTDAKGAASNVVFDLVAP